jgi:hypothetical protein
MLQVVDPLNHQPHLKIKIQSKGNSYSDSVSDKEGEQDVLAHQVLGTTHLGLPLRAKRLPTLAKSLLLKAALQVAHSQRGSTLCSRDWTLTALAYNRGFRTTPWIREQASSEAFKK